MKGTTYKRKDGRWVGCADLGIIDNKRKRKYVYATTQKEARRKLNKLIYQIENNLYKNSDNTTFYSFLNEWYKIHSPKIATTTGNLYKMYIEKHINPEIGNIKLKDLKPVVFDRFYNSKMKSLSPNTIIKLHKLIHLSLNYAVKNDLLATNPSNNVTLPKKTKYTPNIYTEEDFNNLLKIVHGTFDEIPIMLAGVLGLRRGEVFGLRWTDIDFKKRTISISNTLVRWDEYLEKDPKTDMSKRTIIVPEFLLKILKDYLSTLSVVPEKICDKYKPDSYSKRFKRLLIKNELPIIRFHDLRHYNAIIMLKYGISDKVAAERLGHSQISTLKEIYQHTLKDMHEDAANTLENAFISMKK
ncbi:MAG: site-specific integrase [Vallitalea sp.]|nr:site-specific integrase [Vallitalea sp.]